MLRGLLPERGLVLEVASGSGEHALHFARVFPDLLWQPSDPDPAALRSIEAWRAEAGLANLLAPVALDVRTEGWPVEQADALLAINMVHISPWSATEGLMRGAGRLLPAGAPLYLYGAYRQAGVPTAASNEAFDASLRAANPLWGVREPRGRGRGSGKEWPVARLGGADAGQQPVGPVPSDLAAGAQPGRVSRRRQGPVTAKVIPGDWALTNKVRPSGEKQAPANSE